MLLCLAQLQQEEAQKIRDKRANEAALAALTAIGSGTKRKRPSAAEGVSLGLRLLCVYILVSMHCKTSRVCQDFEFESKT